MRSFDLLLASVFLFAKLCLSVEEGKSSDLLIDAWIVPRVTISKSSKLKVYLVLSDHPPGGVSVTAKCKIYPRENLLTRANRENCSADSLTRTLSKRSDFDLQNEAPTRHPEDILNNSNESDFGASSRSMPTSTHRSTIDDTPFFSDAPVWKLQKSTVSFSDSLIESLIIVRDSYPEVQEIEELLLECCLSASLSTSSQGAVLSGTGVSGIVVVDASPFVAVNWSMAPESGPKYPDRNYANPAYIDVSPCPCDLMQQSCDLNCCCDRKCDSAAIGSFDCSTTLASHTSLESSCTNEQTFGLARSFSPLLCVYNKANSPYLGTFYVANPAIHYRSGFPPRSSGQLDIPRLRQQRQSATTTATDQPNSESDHYQYGSPITTVVGPADLPGHLSLPATTFDGKCVTDASPIAFLVPFSSYCVLPAEIWMCTGNSIWSAATYLTVESDSDIHVLSSAVGAEEFANVTVRYFCIDDLVTSGNSPTNCSPPDLTPSFDPVSRTCKNVVTDVSYVITWNGTMLLDIDATLVLGSVNVADKSSWQMDLLVKPATLTQHFKVTFVHKSLCPTSDALVHSTDATGSHLNCTNVTITTPVFKSGNPGYQFGKPLLTGLPRDADNAISNNLSDFRFMDLESASADHLISGDNGISCDVNVGRRILFGENSYSGCRMLFDGGSIVNCSLLRYTALQHLCNYGASTYVSKGGDCNVNNISDFIPILRNDLCLLGNSTLLVHDNSDDTYEKLGVCLNVPTHLEFTVLYGVFGSVDGVPIYEVEGMRTRHLNTTWQICANPSSKSSAICYVEPSGLNISSIYLTSSVDFVFTPYDDSHSTKKFWVIQNSLPCGDTCWNELAHPFTNSLTGDQRAYVTKWAAVIIVLFISVMYMTQDFW